jgi:hypothetical protein
MAKNISGGGLLAVAGTLVTLMGFSHLRDNPRVGHIAGYNFGQYSFLSFYPTFLYIKI